MTALRYVCERCGDDVWREPPIVGPILCNRCLKQPTRRAFLSLMGAAAAGALAPRVTLPRRQWYVSVKFPAYFSDASRLIVLSTPLGHGNYLHRQFLDTLASPLRLDSLTRIALLPGAPGDPARPADRE